jgi:hypothetical protein
MLQSTAAETIDWIEVEGTELDPTAADEMAAASVPEGAHGIRNLMIAVLEDAVRGFVAGNERERQEAEVWVVSRERRFPFAFTVICETLGLEPDAVRQALRRMRRQTTPARRAVIRARRNGRQAYRIRVERR